MLLMEIILIYQRRYFKNFTKYLRKKVKSQGQSVDFDKTLTVCKIREKKDEKILRKLYFQKLEKKWKILIYNS